MELTLATRPGRACVVVQVGGVLDLATVPQVQLELQRALDGGACAVVLDLTGLRLIDSTGLGMVVWLQTQVRQRGGRVGVAATSPLVLSVFELTSVDRLVGVHDSVEAAEADLAAGR